MRTRWLLALAGFFLIGAGWAVALPVNGTYDEKDHITRAYAVAHGQLLPDGYDVDVPPSLVPGDVDCLWRIKPAPAATCQQPAPADRTPARRFSNAARYSPVYYLPVGLPMLASPDRYGIIAGRLVSALMSALLLAAAVAIAWRRRDRVLVMAVILVSTPMVMNLAGSINPNGLEISAAILLWVALLALLRPSGARPAPAIDPVPPSAPARIDPGPPSVPARGERGLLVAVGVAGALLMTVRHMGPLLLGLIVLACLAFAEPGQVRSRLRRRATWWTAGVLALGGVFAVAWTLGSSVAGFAPDPGRAHQWGLAESLRRIATERVPFYVKQLVGQFGYGETVLPTWAVLLWYLPVLALMVAAVRSAGRRYVLVAGGVLAASLAVNVALELTFLPKVGWYAHGRYVMPLAVGAVLAAAYARPRLPSWPWLTPVVAFLTGLLHLYALAKVMSRYQNGIKHPVAPFSGAWLPVTGPFVPIFAAAVGAVLIVAVTLRNGVATDLYPLKSGIKVANEVPGTDGSTRDPQKY